MSHGTPLHATEASLIARNSALAKLAASPLHPWADTYTSIGLALHNAATENA